MSLWRPRNRLEAVLRTLLAPILYSIPAAVFFGTLFGRGAGGYVLAFKMSLVFAYVVSLAMMAAGRLHQRVFPGDRDTTPMTSRSVLIAVYYMVTSIAASFVGATLIHFTILPGFLGSPRQFLIAGMFALLFSVLAMAVVYAWVFYHRALDRARSEEELKLARRIQRAFLLSDFPELPGLEVHAVNLSSRQVSGDFYDVVPAGPGAWLLAIADVSGKGVPAALLTSMLQASLRTQAESGGRVAAILAAINRLVVRSAPAGKFATVFLARLDLDPLRLTYSNAGHNHPVLHRRDGRRRPLASGGTVVGMMDGPPFAEETVALEPGDRLVMFTDGVSEAENAAGAMYGEDRLHDLVAGLPASLGAREVSDRILADVNAFLGGAEAGDDITLLVLCVLEREPARAAAPAAASAPAAAGG